VRRGALRIYLGYAAGVGKTFAMLGEGSRRQERGGDVVVGFVETHGRPKTRERLADLEIVPRRTLTHRDATFEEMDVDAIVARAPEVVLVDELAHTNVPGSRNQKRWEDVEEILEAGVDVISTVNVQHLESLNDVVERITGVKQRETIPDEVVRAADQVELVDMTPFALRRRMAHGNIYPAEKIDAALANYFREGNLGALRELALLWMADRVDEALQDYMHDHGIEGPWETRERILVGVSGRAEDESLIRRAARMATRRGGELLAVHVISEEGPEVLPALETTRKLVEMVGGSFHEVVGRNMPDALLDFARAENVTQVVLGASKRPRSRQLLRPSVINRVIRDSGPIDVHVISMSEAQPHEPLRAKKVRGVSARRRAFGAVFALVTLPVVTVLLAGSRDRVGLSSVLLIYLLIVVGTAAIGGLWPALAAAVASSLLTNYYFVPPIHTWTIAEPEHLFAIFVFVAVAAVVSGLVNRAARLRAEAQRGRAEAEALAHLAGRLVADDDPLPGLVEHVRTTFGLDAVSVLRDAADGGWIVEAGAGPGPPSAPDQGTETLDLGEDSSLVIRGPLLPAESRRVLSAFVAQLAVAVRARALKREADDAAELVEVNDLRAAILAAVSHDLRTPLASVKAAVSSLRQDDVTWNADEVAEFLATIEEETDRLSSLVGNLLDASRIQTGSLRLVHHLVGLDEVVPKALASLSDHGRGIEVDVPETLPRVDVDAALLERAIANIASNARSHGASEDPVRILGSEAGGRVELRIVDRGPGIPLGERQRVFEPFQRLGDRPSGDGVGLGLAVARGFVEAMGGEVEVEDTPGGGLTMVLAFKAEP
jgi:two-component system, OmpR family, sensor histidine kinase KdpD